ncbi:hypothetical protein SADUNF_Sadunf17G0112200 [Salix dunnii]|uniref:Uncharacterized protein n=1 Tax=Salix dunnii TaxID=1413687 RepID=A0A835JB10_9ROSI|nr:hypothetical protein SADUNF_Sadunf17G0112200 [Salix dunnii]
MIKRRFFKAEHGEKDEASSDSSSSSDSEAEASGQSEDDVVTEPEENSESEDDDTVAEPKEDTESEASSSSSSGYESEDSSENAIDGDSSGRICNGKITIYNETGDDRKTLTGIKIRKKQSNVKANEESVPDDIQDCILKCKSVYKCRICPQTICLTEETMRAHLNSKRHARSEKLMKENRLKVMLNRVWKIDSIKKLFLQRPDSICSFQTGKSKNNGTSGTSRTIDHKDHFAASYNASMNTSQYWRNTIHSQEKCQRKDTYFGS